MLISQKDIDRFWSKIVFPTDVIVECWEWGAGKKNNGYGAFGVNYRSILAHRFSYIIHNEFKELTIDEKICHECDNPGCVNPNHLFIGSAKDNSQDMVNKGRSLVGSKHGMSLLNEEQVVQILIDIYNNKYTNINEISKQYNVKLKTISHILQGFTWKHITNQLQVSLEDIRYKVMQKPIPRKLNENKVIQIKMLLKSLTGSEIAKQFNISQGTVYDIKHGRIWKNVA